MELKNKYSYSFYDLENESMDFKNCVNESNSAACIVKKGINCNLSSITLNVKLIHF